MPPVLRGEGKLCHQIIKKKQKHSFIALFYQNQITFITLNSAIPSTTAADFPLNYGSFLITVGNSSAKWVNFGVIQLRGEEIDDGYGSIVKFISPGFCFSGLKQGVEPLQDAIAYL